MTIIERLELIRAGYTKEEIAAFDSPEDPKPEDPKPDAGNNEVLAAIAALTKAIQAQNMQKIGLDSPGKLTAEQALAQGVFGNK